jgi:prepilin-type N-terminal cleavage/methylation domain-containing protein
MTTMQECKRRDQGFTLLEIIVVLAVIGALAAMLAPVVFRYIDDAKKAQASNDALAIAAAIQQEYKDTGRWPFYKNGTGKLAYTSGTDAAILTSNTACAGTAANTCDTTIPVDTTGSNTWGLAAGLADSLTAHMINNSPFTGNGGAAYSMTGGRAWKGPYLDRIPPLDPWGRSYLVNISNADPASEGPSTQKWVVVLSAGPNGNIETLANSLGTANPGAAGDDIIARVK